MRARRDGGLSLVRATALSSTLLFLALSPLLFRLRYALFGSEEDFRSHWVSEHAVENATMDLADLAAALRRFQSGERPRDPALVAETEPLCMGIISDRRVVPYIFHTLSALAEGAIAADVEALVVFVEPHARAGWIPNLRSLGVTVELFPSAALVPLAGAVPDPTIPEAFVSPRKNDTVPPPYGPPMAAPSTLPRPAPIAPLPFDALDAPTSSSSSSSSSVPSSSSSSTSSSSVPSSSATSTSSSTSPGYFSASEPPLPITTATQRYGYVLQTLQQRCRRASSILVLEDDAGTSWGWDVALGRALRNVRRRDPAWLWLKLFFPDNFVGWEGQIADWFLQLSASAVLAYFFVALLRFRFPFATRGTVSRAVSIAVVPIFLFLHGVGRQHLPGILQPLNVQGLVPWENGSSLVAQAFARARVDAVTRCLRRAPPKANVVDLQIDRCVAALMRGSDIHQSPWLIDARVQSEFERRLAARRASAQFTGFGSDLGLDWEADVLLADRHTFLLNPNLFEHWGLVSSQDGYAVKGREGLGLGTLAPLRVSPWFYGNDLQPPWVPSIWTPARTPLTIGSFSMPFAEPRAPSSRVPSALATEEARAEAWAAGANHVRTERLASLDRLFPRDAHSFLRGSMRGRSA